MKYLALFVAVLALSCTEGGPGSEYPVPEPTPEPPQPLPRVRIETADGGRSVFEIMQFNVSVGGMSGSDNVLSGGFLLSAHYDSLVWSVPDRGMRFKLFESGESYYRYTFSFGHSFFSPGEFDTRLSGYKDGGAVYEFEYPVTVRNDRDFLDYDWANITGNSPGGRGYADVFAEEHLSWDYVTSTWIHDGIPSVSMHIIPAGGVELPGDRERKLLFDAIGGIYGEPTYDEAGGEAQARYGELFHHVEPYAEPLCIWLTAKSMIVLSRMGDDTSSPMFPVPPLHRYSVYAEPVR